MRRQDSQKIDGRVAFARGRAAVAKAKVTITVGSVGETVSVTAEAAMLKTERADVSDAMTQQVIEDLPVLGRDMSRLYFLLPGVQANGTTAASEQPQDICRPKIGGQYWGGVAVEAGVAFSPDGKPQAGMGVSAADYDGDGNLDIVKTNFAGDTPSQEQLDQSEDRWNQVEPMRNRSPHLLHHPRRPPPDRQVRSGGSYISQSDLRVHFGLASATEAAIEIHLPSGLITRLKTPVNRIITVVENPTA